MAEEFGTFPLAQGFIALTGMLLQEFEHNVDPPHLQYRLAQCSTATCWMQWCARGLRCSGPRRLRSGPQLRCRRRAATWRWGTTTCPHCGHRLGELATGAIAH